MSRFVELTRIPRGYIVINIDEILTIKETTTRKTPIKDSSYTGPYSIISFRGGARTAGATIIVKEVPPDIVKKFKLIKDGDLW